MMLPSTTTRSLTGIAPRRGRRSRDAQWHVARLPEHVVWKGFRVLRKVVEMRGGVVCVTDAPFSKPAAPRTREPVQTEVMKLRIVLQKDSVGRSY